MKSNCFWITFIILILVPEIITSQESPKQKYLDINFFHAEYSQYLFLLGGFIIVLIIRYYIRMFEIRIPSSVFAIIIGVIWGVLAIKIDVLKPTTKIFKTVMTNAELIYLPLIVYGTAFCIDVHAFLKSLPQILIISIPLFLLNGFMCGTFTAFVMGDWSIIDGIFFGMMINAIYPLEILHWLKETNQTRQVIVLLEGETIISTAMCIYTFFVIKLNLEGWIVHWYQFVMGVVRLLFINLPLSYSFGSVTSCLLRICYNDSLSLSLVTIVSCFSSYVFFGTLTTVGSLGCLITGLLMGMERTSLPSEMEKSLIKLWKAIISLLNGMLFLIIGGMAPELMEMNQDVYVYALVFVTYLISNMSRFISFFVFSPLLSRIGYGMTFKNMVLCVWGGLKHPLSLSITEEVKQVYGKKDDKYHLFYIHCVVVYLLYLFINATFLPIILKALGLTELSIAKELNMNNCVKYILQGRDRTIAILKMDRFLSDANWPLVMTTTAFKYPYRKKGNNVNESDSEDEEELFMGNRFSVCPDCKKRVPNETTTRELKEMTKEAKMRLLKLRKIFYSRRYESGMLTKEGARIAQQSVEVALDSEQKQIEIDGLVRMFYKESFFYRFLQKRFMYLFRLYTKDLQFPKKRLRMICFRIKNHIAFTMTKHVVNLCNLIIAIYIFARIPAEYSPEFTIIASLNMALLLIYITFFTIKILGLSEVYIWRDGFRRYFCSLWNILSFIVMCVLFVEMIRYWVERNKRTFRESGANLTFLQTTTGMRFISLFEFLQLIEYYRKLGTHLITFLDIKIDSYRMMAFELGKNYIAGEEELIENIAAVVDNDRIRAPLKEKIQQDRHEVTRTFGFAQKDRPSVAVTVKTKLAITTVLKSMKDDLQELKMSGWVDDIEYCKLNKSLAERYRFVNTILSVEPSAPTLVFREVSWMGNEENIINYLYENVITKKFDPGDVICNEGEMIEGIYILIAGIFLLSYNPQKTVVDKLNEAGILPITDYVSPTNFYEKTEEYIIPGNSIGEFSMLTDRPYNCTITAEAHSQVFVIRRDIVKQAMEMDPDPVNGLECRIWKMLSFRIALPVLINAAPYRSYKMENLKYVINRSFVPNISNYKIFNVNEMIEDIVLIEGVAVDLHTRDVYTGPCYIQRSVQKLILPKSSTLNMDLEIESKLLVLPAKEFDEYEIMLTEEKMCELVSHSSTRCLQHLIQERLTKKKNGTQRKKKKSSTKLTKKADSKTGGSRNKITFEQLGVDTLK